MYINNGIYPIIVLVPVREIAKALRTGVSGTRCKGGGRPLLECKHRRAAWNGIFENRDAIVFLHEEKNDIILINSEHPKTKNTKCT